jgi:hypothetical protein
MTGSRVSLQHGIGRDETLVLEGALTSSLSDRSLLVYFDHTNGKIKYRIRFVSSDLGGSIVFGYRYAGFTGFSTSCRLCVVLLRNNRIISTD